MDMELTEEQQMLATSVHEFMARECPLTVVRELEEHPFGYSPEMWRKMADLGWLGLPFSEDLGGAEGSNVDLVVLNKEIGRALCPSPYTTSVLLSGGAIEALGSPKQKETYLSAIIDGKSIIPFAFQEPAGFYGPEGVHAIARKEGEDFVIEGEKSYVEFAEAADTLLVTARSNGGLGLFLVDPHAAGLTVTPLRTLARDRESKLTFSGVRVSPEAVVGPPGDAWTALERVIQRATVALCAQFVGAMVHAHEVAVDYAKIRVQFGRPIGAFQTIQQYLAQSIMEIYAAETMTYYAAWSLDRGSPSRAIVAKTKAFVGDTYRNTAFISAQIFGGLGGTDEADVTLFLRRGKQAQLMMGDSWYYQDIVAEEILDR